MVQSSDNGRNLKSQLDRYFENEGQSLSFTIIKKEFF